MTVPPLPGSTEAIRAAVEGALPGPGWTFDVEEIDGFTMRVRIQAESARDADTVLALRASLALEVDQVRPAGYEVRIEITVPDSPPTYDDLDFVSQLRTLRGDYGSCVHCGEAFGENEATSTDKRGRVHGKCVFVDTCPGCDKPVVRSDRSTLTLGHRTHTDCADRAIEQDRQRKERAARVEARASTQAASRALIARAIMEARADGIIVAVVVPEHEVESTATMVLTGYSYMITTPPRGKIVSNGPGRKAIAWTDTKGMVIVESASRGSLVEAGKGYRRAYLTTAACRQSPGLPSYISSCFDLPPDQVIVQEEQA